MTIVQLVLILLLAAVALVGVVASMLAVLRDGFGPVPTDPKCASADRETTSGTEEARLR